MTEDLKDHGQTPKKTVKPLDPVAQFNSFFVNEHHAYIARKAERLSAAVHVVTGFIETGEPLRNLLRSTALELLLWSTDPQRLGTHGVETYNARAAEIGNMLGTAEAAGLVSTMNARLIIDEYARLASFVRERYSFIRSQSSAVLDTHATVPEHFSKGQKDISAYRTVHRNSVSDIPRIQSSRRSEILLVLDKKDRISIKDVAQIIGGVSEKTLQRELLAMVADGLLIKEGERRWSTYRRVTGQSKPDSKSDLQ